MQRAGATLCGHVGGWCLKIMPLSCLSERSVLPPGVMMASGPELLSRATSGSVALSQPGSVMMFITSVTTEDHMDAQGLVNNLSPGGCLKAMVTSRPGLR